MDLSSGALRALLEILNERTFSRGEQRIVSPLMTAIATTNFNRDDEEELKAVLDRFMFRSVIHGLKKTSERRLMLDCNKVDVPKVSLQDIRLIQKAVAKVHVPSSIKDTYLSVCEGLEITDRKVMHCLKVVQASAVLRGRCHAILEDIGSLYVCLAIPGNTKSEAQWGTALIPYRDKVKQHKEELAVYACYLRSRVIAQAIDAATTYDDCVAWAIEAVTLSKAVDYYNTSTATSAHASEAKSRITKALEKATFLYHQDSNHTPVSK
jgi:hypothetical protein